MRKIKLLFALILFLFVGAESRAQFSTIDIANLGTAIDTKVQQSVEHIENIEMLFQSLTEAKNLTSTVSGAYRLLSNVVKDASVIRDVYQNYLMIQEDIERIKRFSSIIESGNISPRRVATMYSIADKVLSDAYNEFKYISDVLLSPQESVTMMDRLEKIGELNDTMVRNRHLLDNLMKDIMGDKNNQDAEDEKAEYLKTAFGGISNPSTTIMPTLNLTDIEELVERREPSADMKKAKAKFDDKETIADIFDLAAVLIGIIAVGYTVWNFMLKNSGDRQKQDSQFKVFSGMLIGILLLEALKAMFF